jgi:hypothetical protein
MDINNAVAALTAKIATMTTDQITESVQTLSAAPLNADSRMVRAHLIEEFIRRNGEAAGDALMDAVGL